MLCGVWLREREGGVCVVMQRALCASLANNLAGAVMIAKANVDDDGLRGSDGGRENRPASMHTLVFLYSYFIDSLHFSYN